MTDVIDRLAGIRPGDRLDALRRHRPVTREQAEASYEALFGPGAHGTVTRDERFAVAAFVASLHTDETAARHYAEPLDAALAARIAALAAEARTTGPYGDHPAGPLAAESEPGIRFALDATAVEALGPRLAAALEHAHLLVFRPRESSPEALAALAAAGWSTDGIVTLSQLVSFLAFQLRVVAGLRLLAAEEAA
ncbi:CMD domain protein [Agromyces archimandritae]|uniref:CMD domain protein n=1 Tax=Agromyces archimandritae TaxID=2781962 RepID=A0A975FKR9_9MICO|nr:CMD domain protein [Agromyces archimandritae]QTX03671.1 CMD domain protein [Agromyces archimandritae]